MATIKFYEEVKNIRRRQYLDCDIIRDEERFRCTMFRKEWSTWGPKWVEPDVPQRSRKSKCLALQDAENWKAFEAAITSDYDAGRS